MIRFSTRQTANNGIYVSFPYSPWRRPLTVIPFGMEEWLEENTEPLWDYILGSKVGVYLYKDDAVAFKLRWS